MSTSSFSGSAALHSGMLAAFWRVAGGALKMHYANPGMSVRFLTASRKGYALRYGALQEPP